MKIRRRINFFSIFLMTGIFSTLQTCKADFNSGEKSKNSHLDNHIQHSEHEFEPHEFVPVSNLLGDEEPGVETHYVYMNLKKSAHLQCADIDTSSLPGNHSQEAVTWFKTIPATETSSKMLLPQNCLNDKDDDENSKCYIVYSQVNNNPSQFYSTFRIRRVEKEDYGEYDCRVNGRVIRKFILQGELRAIRKTNPPENKKGETERSVFVDVGSTLDLYCNYSTQESDNWINISSLDYVGVTWFKLKPGETDEDTSAIDANNDTNTLKKWDDITDDLRNMEGGTFVNFTEIPKYPNQFRGIANHSHRGVYMCFVNVLRHEESIVYEKMFPVVFKFKVRVQDGNRWMMPGGILLVEILGIAIFTAVIWKREDSKEVDNDAVPQDSDSDTTDENPKMN